MVVISYPSGGNNVAKVKESDTADQETALASSKLKKLIVKNFRCIGSTPVEIDLDDIVVLVGPNNVGKSTILRAYEVVMNHGSKAGELALEDFPNEKIDALGLPEIELQTYVKDDKPADHWLFRDSETQQTYVKERWIWSAPGPPKRQGHPANSDDWDDHVPWGAPNVAKVRRPQPQRIDAFASPEEQANKIIELLKKALLDRAKQTNDDGGQSLSAFTRLKNHIATVQNEVLIETQSTITNIETQLTSLIEEVFTGFRVTLDAKPEEIGDKALNLFAANPILRMGPADGHLAPIDKQGSGARRTLLWAALKLLGEQAPPPKTAKATPKKPAAETNESTEGSRPNVLLIDEPEICLHPNAIREACRVLYDLARAGSNWQVMVTTHSPAFIDLARDNTTIVRVERNESGAIEGTTVFRPDRVRLDDNDRKNLKLLNVWDPYVGEFFFGGRTILVEGDTEYSVFRWLIDEDRNTFKNIHVVRARGKGILISLIKILNHFGAGYSVLHDSDRPPTTGETNSAWGTNQSIIDAVNACPDPARVRLVAAVPDFEGAIFGTLATSDKPFKAVTAVTSDANLRSNARQLLLALVDHSKPLPSGVIQWKCLDELEKALPK